MWKIMFLSTWVCLGNKELNTIKMVYLRGVNYGPIARINDQYERIPSRENE